ncbi:hypothetical protein [Actinoallomurus soli]|uniref:hypothetical protein n=1 Tax=Actinoallomurus soli TaxID=2952535 RepID=UPI002092167F|nr:hypothetical protein [Actinoallomurus soli]MCO5971185.1 hypothetical protein [Actinoallomurus soli]
MSPPAALRDSPRYRVLKALAAGSPGLLTGAVVFMLAEGLIPNLVLIARGRPSERSPPPYGPGWAGPTGRCCCPG